MFVIKKDSYRRIKELLILEKEFERSGLPRTEEGWAEFQSRKKGGMEKQEEAKIRPVMVPVITQVKGG